MAVFAGGVASFGQESDQLGKLFAADGTPLDHHFSYMGIADLAAAAVRAERHLEARALVERALALVEPAPRLDQMAARARGLLAEPADAEPHSAAGLADAAGDSWPFERAQLQLYYGERLRRQRRINDAKHALGAARLALRARKIPAATHSARYSRSPVAGSYHTRIR